MCKKRGQVTVFVVIGLIIIVFLSLFFYISNRAQQKELEQATQQVQHFSSSVLQVKPYVTECIQNQATIAIILAAKQRDHDNLTLPPISVMEQSIANYVNDNIGLCTNFEIFKTFDVDAGKINSTVSIVQDNVLIDVAWPLSFEQDGLTLYEDEFRVIFPLKLKEMYEKVETIAGHNVTLDVQFMLSQNLNLEILGCEDGSVSYMVNDNDYLLDENILRFFFNTPIEELSELFEFDDGIMYKPLSMPGKHVLRLEDENKTITFQINDDGSIFGCYAEDISESYFTKSLVENNKVPVSVATKHDQGVDIRKAELSSSSLMLSNAYSVSGIGTSAVLILKNNFKNLIPKLYDSNFNEIPAEVVGDYVKANITKPGTYVLGTEYCSLFKKGSGLNVIFVPVSYDNMTLFGEHVKYYTDALFDVSPVDDFAGKFNIYYTIKPNNFNCIAWNSANCSVENIKAETGICAVEPDYIVALIDDSLVGLDHKTESGVSFVGSYLTFNQRYCSECNFVREFGHFMGLADEFAYLGSTSANSTYPNCDNEFSGNESQPCSKWSNVQGTGCYAGCIYENWYRPTKGFVLEGNAVSNPILVNQSIMRGDLIGGQSLKIDNIYFGPVSSIYLREKLSALK
ncbi:hypothetical protein KY311_04855 [Candidatus Woesearchaeota archaeon]|nr:hypothetical protein [Candidatus Woesearchaeota archaeon]